MNETGIRRRPVGHAQGVVLTKLDSLPGGEWTQADGALWDNIPWTRSVLESLVPGGYVEEQDGGRKYVITAKGKAVIPRG